LTAAVVGLALTTAAACSGGGGDKSDADADNGFTGPVGEKQLQFTGAGGKVRISGTLTMPANVKGAAPAVLIVPGPGPNDRDGRTVGAPPDNLYKDLSKALVAAGMATFRYDHRGIGASTLEPGQQPTWDDMVVDAQEALKYIGQRGEIDGSRLAVVGHDMGGPIALKLAATDLRVKSVALVAVPGRPLADVWADELRALNGQEAADSFRAVVATLLATGSYPPRETMRAEVQTSLPVGQDALYKSLFSVDPLADASKVKVPVLLGLGEKSNSVSAEDADRITKAVGGTTDVVVATNATATLQTLRPAPRLVPGGDPTDMSSMGGGAPVAFAPRDEPTVARITSFLGASLNARPA
jgi:pimeloyl-ACP methyl ester carboxylesterase